MDRNEAMKLLSEIKLYLTAGNPVWDLEVVAEACDMAIEALRNEINCVNCVHYTERETYTGIKGVCKMDTAHREDLISRQGLCRYALNQKDKSVTPNDIMRFPSAETPTVSEKHQLSEETPTNAPTDLISIQMAIEHWGRSSGNLTNDQIAELQREIESLPSADEQDDNRLYIRIYANDEPSRKAEKLYQICGETESQEVAQWLKEYFPSVDRPTTDCTEFMEWLKAEVLDEDNWELNAVAYGEIICRKLKKLGWIDVEDGFYVDTRPTGEWEEVEDYNGDIHYQCDQCGEEFILIDGTPKDNNYWHCPNCGSYNREVREHDT